jgi:hypothetical protein
MKIDAAKVIVACPGRNFVTPEPYQRAYLPVARLEDGTMWNW